ncbi:RNA polymerase-binding transcription factor DksA [Mycoplana sp. BE70]|uniref:TraR/DksA family transcriptional regulator n=1 Tax=Mycoplana sp. BE70 TaxID=2817775 RepID=UPI00285CCA3E|nr:TraR/DksA C4-type zinc finger protein [Mycoplana sp. BE70]MDR6755991.1 RNA polymerase-binding transcription factor DksA [Mycoplana sp. BE70]
MLDTALFKDRLVGRKHELYRRLHKIEGDLEATPNPDAEERATERESDEVLEEIGNTGLDELAAIDAALDRIEAGTFGICPKCGNPISPRRLEAVPQAALCEECIKR